jgi:hypothetical protein
MEMFFVQRAKPVMITGFKKSNLSHTNGEPYYSANLTMGFMRFEGIAIYTKQQHMANWGMTSDEFDSLVKQ